MAVHQYIGARYVPYYYENSLDPTSTEWEPNVNYEALTVVTLPNQHSYISKKAVPDTIGSPALNAEYWLDTGNDNAYIQALQDQIDAINEFLKTKVNKKYIFIFDSYGPSIFNYLPGIMGLSATDYYMGYKGGAGFANSDPELNFLTVLQNLESSVDDPDSISDIVVLGGVNEYYWDESDIISGIDAFIAYAKTTYPNAIVNIGMIGGTTNANFIGWKFAKLTRTYSRCKGGRFLNNLQYVLHDYSLIGGDGIHPTDAGAHELAYKISEALHGGTSVEYYAEGVLTPRANWSLTPDSDAGKFYVGINNNTLTVEFRSGRFGISNIPDGSLHTISVGAWTAVEIGDISCDLLIGAYETIDSYRNYTRHLVTANVRSKANEMFYQIDGYIFFAGGKLYFMSGDARLGSTTAYQTVDFITFTCGPITVDTLYT